jgi:hypothetical protein
MQIELMMHATQARDLALRQLDLHRGVACPSQVKGRQAL